MASDLSDSSFVSQGNARPLDRLLREYFSTASWNAVRRAIISGKVRIDDRVVRDPRTRIAAGCQVRLQLNAPRKPRPARLAKDAVVHCDAQIAVVRKLPGINTVAHDESHDEASLQQLASARIGSHGHGHLLVVQRLDRESSGLVVFARTPAAQQHLKQQFLRHEVTRRYLAIAYGHVGVRTYRSRLVYEEDGHGHSVRDQRRGKPAVTHVQPQQLLRQATLLACRLETGRTHQIRIHLAEAGHPLLGDKMYGPRDQRVLRAPRLMLHAATLGFVHPTTGRALGFDEPLPKDMRKVIAALSSNRSPS